MKGIDVELLVRQPFFRGMEPDQLRPLLECSRREEHPAGRLLLRQGDAADAAHLLLEGSVALELAVPGREPLVLETLGAGELVGASWLLPPARVHFDVRTRERVATLRMETACLRRVLEEESALGYAFCRRFMEVMVKRLQATRLQLMDLYGHPELYPPCRREPGEESR